MIAAQEGHLDIVNALLCNGANIDDQSKVIFPWASPCRSCCRRWRSQFWTASANCVVFTVESFVRGHTCWHLDNRSWLSCLWLSDNGLFIVTLISPSSMHLVAPVVRSWDNIVQWQRRIMWSTEQFWGVTVVFPVGTLSPVTDPFQACYSLLHALQRSG